MFCFNDLLAVGALHAAAEQGIEVPRDLAVVGFDGSEEGAYTRPPLTTIAPDIAAIAEQAVGCWPDMRPNGRPATSPRPSRCKCGRARARVGHGP